MRDSLYENVPFQVAEIPHRYGKNVHLVGNPFLLSQLATLCAKGTIQPQVNRLVATLYTDLVKTVINAEFPRKKVAIPTRMIDSTPQAIYQGEVIDPEVRAVTVNIARAGTLPSQVAFDLLNTVLTPALPGLPSCPLLSHRPSLLSQGSGASRASRILTASPRP